MNIKNAYATKVGQPIVGSDHNVVYMTPVSNYKLKRSKPVKKVVRTWTRESKEQLKACFHLTDWDVLREPSLDETTTVTNDYINF